MKRIFALFFVLLFCSTSCFAWGWKKNSAEKNFNESGYVGTLPDLSSGYKTEGPKKSKSSFNKTKKFNSVDEIKPVPRDNPAFVNIILKEDKTSPYLNDINNDILPQLENLLICIEKNFDVQKFNAKVYFFNKTIEFLENKYFGKPEYNYISFQKLLELNTHTKTLATLRSEAEKYRPYLAYTGTGYLYNDNVINEQLEFLRIEIEDTIIVLKQTE